MAEQGFESKLRDVRTGAVRGGAGSSLFSWDVSLSSKDTLLNDVVGQL